MEILFILIILLTIVTVVGHLIWVVLAAIVRAIFVEEVVSDETVQRPDPRRQRLKNLAITEDQISQFYSNGALSEKTFEELMERIRAERVDLVTPRVAARTPIPVSVPVQAPPPVATVVKPSTDYTEKITVKATAPPPPPPPRPPRRSFSEVLNAFMEESNIRWGEIIGGLLIIGCSTALVVSLWAQISQIPVLKFLIFTTVTAILFGIGLYTEHRWKLPTTSRGILTIATLLVPLNFLAIAAVSSSNTSGALVIGSELAAPAIFLCLVYFAGRVITPGCGHILSAGVLGSSVGQLLVRHFASLDYSPALLIFLGAFPVACYVVTVGLALRFVLHDREIDESETTTIFTVFGTMSFAALLPFGLLLYKSGPIGMSMMYLAPLVTLWGVPMVATGTILSSSSARRSASVGAQSRPTLRALDYPKWESLGAGTLSPNGQWLAYGVNRVNEENELRLGGIGRDTTVAILYGDAGLHGRLAVARVRIGVSPAERDRLTKDKKPIRNSAGVRNLRLARPRS